MSPSTRRPSAPRRWDVTAIAIETARQLGLGTHIIPAAEAFPKDMDPNNVPPDIAEAIERADGFAASSPSTSTPSSRSSRCSTTCRS